MSEQKMSEKVSGESVEEFWARTLKGIKAKADHNKNEALACFVLLITSTLLGPLFLNLGEKIPWGAIWIWDKLIPSFLSLLAAAIAAWLQLRKPQQLWAMYRTAQRRLEDEGTKWRFQLDDYKKPDQPDTGPRAE